MKEGLLERVKANTHWRVNIRPRPALSQKLSFQNCNEYVDQARVSIRGWDFPHISRRQDDQGGSSIEGEFVENWCDWYAHVEFWRMYRSGQFLSYISLRENHSEYADDDLPGGIVSIVGTIYSITEFFEFATRLATAVPYPGGYNIVVGLRGVRGRQLSVGPNRIPFFEPKATGAENIELEREVEDVSPGRARDLALDMLLELFDHFGWNPDRSQIARDQTKFLKREF